MASLFLMPVFYMTASAAPYVPDDTAQQCAAPGDVLSIEQALRLAALRPTRAALRSQLYAELARLDVVADRPFVPRVSLYAQTLKTQASGTFGVDTEGARWLTTTYTAQAGVRTSWQGPIGTRLDLDVANSRQQIQPSTFAITNQPQVTLTLSQPLLKGAGLRVATAAQRQAQRARQVAYLQYAVNLADDSVAVANGYVQALSAQQQLIVAEDALKAARNVRDAMEHYLAAGVRPAADLRRAQLSVSQSETSLNSARALHQTAMLTLAPLVGCPLGREWRLQSPRVNLARQDATLRTDNDRDLPEIIIRRVALEDAELAQDVALNATKPDLSVLAGYSRVQGVGPSVNWSVGLSLNLPLNDYEAHANLTASRYRVRQAQSDLEQAHAQASVQLQSAALSVGSAQRQLLLAREQLRFATQVLEDEDARLRAGRSTLLEWQTALSTRATSQVALEQAEADVYLAQLGLWRARGTLLQELGVDVPVQDSDAL